MFQYYNQYLQIYREAGLPYLIDAPERSGRRPRRLLVSYQKV